MWVANGSAQLVEGGCPGCRRWSTRRQRHRLAFIRSADSRLPTDEIANTMKLAIVSIEDKRFAEHNGVDWKGTLTGLSGYMSGNLDTRGGSTIE